MVYILRDVCTKLPYCIHMHSYIRISLSMWFTLVVVGGITCFAYQKTDLHNLSVCVCVCVCVCVYVGGGENPYYCNSGV